MKKMKQFLSLFLVCFICFSAIQVHAENEMSEKRIKKAKEMGLERMVDEEGFLIDDFYVDKSCLQLEEMGVHELIKSMTPEELDAYVSRLNAGIMLYTVTKYQKIQEGYDITGVFEVDGVLAYCIQHSKTTPAAGSPTSTAVESNNENLRKVLYYGYNGPADKGYSYVQTAMAASEANGVPAGNTGVRVLREISQLPSPPAGFKVWVVHTNGGSTQDLAYYVYAKGGAAKLQKQSGNLNVTTGNANYSLKGAVYGVYSDKACTSRKATLTTDEKGVSNVVELDEGTYYVKEITAPQGYALNAEVYTVAVVSGTTAQVQTVDAPQMTPIEVLLEKVDAKTQEAIPQGMGTFENAEFAVKFYKGAYMPDETPERSWVFKTDANGVCKFQEEYKVSGDEFWLDANGNPALPLGTVTIQEMKAPEGYHLNPEIFVREITGEGSAPVIHTYQKVTVEEKSIDLELVKRQEGTTIVIPGAVFEHTRPDGTTERVVTDQDGKLHIIGLQQGRHKLKEIAVMDGYLLNANEITFEISEKNEITLNKEYDDAEGKTEVYLTEDGTIVVEMEDLLAPYSIVVEKENEKGKRLSDAEFTLYSDKACEHEIQKGNTNQNGILEFQDLKVGEKYYLKETKAPEGYRLVTDLFGQPKVYEIYAESVPVEHQFSFYLDGSKCDTTIKIINRIGRKLPNTGSMWMMPILAAGSVCCILTVRTSRKNTKRRKRV